MPTYAPPAPGITLDQAVELDQAGLYFSDISIHVTGENLAVTTTEFIGALDGAYPYLINPEPFNVRVKAGGDAADTAAGDGARTILVVGLDNLYRLVYEELTLAGASASAVSLNQYRRILRVTVKEVGAGATQTNVGVITLEKSDGSQSLTAIPIGEGIASQAAFTIPAGYTGYLTRFTADADIGSASGTVDIHGIQRINGDDGTNQAASLFTRLPSVSRSTGSVERNYTVQPYEFPEKTDIWFTGTPSNDSPACAVTMSLLLVRNRITP